MTMEELLAQELANMVALGTNTISGPDFAKLFKIISGAGFTNAQLMAHLESKGIQIKSPEAPINETHGFTRLH